MGTTQVAGRGGRAVLLAWWWSLTLCGTVWGGCPAGLEPNASDGGPVDSRLGFFDTQFALLDSANGSDDSRSGDGGAAGDAKADSLPSGDGASAGDGGTALTLCVREIAQAAATCPPGFKPLGGGTKCNLGTLSHTSPTDDGWSGTCNNASASTETYLLCGDTGVARVQVKQTSATAAAQAACPAGAVATGGGCRCAAGVPLARSRPDANNASWLCTCGAAGATEAWAICATNAGALGLTHVVKSELGGNVKAQCAAGALVLSGGCAGGTAKIRETNVASSSHTQWRCVFNSTESAVATVTCTTQPVPVCL